MDGIWIVTRWSFQIYYSAGAVGGSLCAGNLMMFSLGGNVAWSMRHRSQCNVATGVGEEVAGVGEEAASAGEEERVMAGAGLGRGAPRAIWPPR